MMLTDDDLRAVVSARVALAPDPLTPAQLRARWERPRPAARTEPFPRRALAAAAALVLVVASVIAIGSRGRDPGPGDGGTILPSGPTVGRYFVPASLPDGYQLLSFTERPGDPEVVVPAQSLWRQAATGWLVHLQVGEPTTGGHPHSVRLGDGGIASWSDPPGEVPDTLGSFPIDFTVERPGSVVWGQADRRLDESMLRDLFDRVRIQEGLPVLDGGGFELVSSRPETTAPVAASWTAIYGPPGGYLGAGSVVVTASRSTSPIDVPLELRLWTDTVERGGRTLHVGFMGGMYRWFPSEDVEVEVSGHGALPDILGDLVEIDARTLDDEVIPSIEPGAEGLAVADRIEFSAGEVVEFLGPRDSPRGVCVDVDGSRRCDLGIMSNAGYTFEDTIQLADVDLLVDGRWFTVGVRADRAMVAVPVPDGAEVVDLVDRIYYLVERPADAAVVPAGDAWSTVRPSR